MKTYLLTSILLVSGIANTFATHYRAADITYNVISNNTIEATVTTYSKYEGISINADKDEIVINWGDGSSSTVARANGVDSDGNGFKDGEFIIVSPELIKKSVYTAIHIYSGLPPAPQNAYIISCMDINRIDGINNIQSGNSIEIPIYVEDTIFSASLSTTNNHAPRFLSTPIFYTSINDTLTFNLLAYDKDGDSLYFELTEPLQNNGFPVPLYLWPDDYCQINGFSNNNLSFNNQTGQIQWISPCHTGIFNLALRVTEYRCGVPLSTVMVGWEVIVLNEPNNSPAVLPITDISVTAGDTINFTASAYDINNTQTIELVAQGGLFLDLQNPPVFQSVAGNPATGTFSWIPDTSFNSANPYIISITAKDNFTVNTQPPTALPYTSCQTFRIWVIDNSPCTFRYSSISEPEDSRGYYKLFPSPSENEINIETHYSAPDYIYIYSATGQLVSTINAQTNGSYNIAHLKGGLYFVRSYRDNKFIGRFVKL